MNDIKWRKIIAKYKLSSFFVYGLEPILSAYKKQDHLEEKYQKLLTVLENCLESTSIDYTSDEKEVFILFYLEFSKQVKLDKELKDVFLKVIANLVPTTIQLQGTIEDDLALTIIKQNGDDIGEQAVKTCLVITELNDDYFTISFSNDFQFIDYDIYGKIIQRMNKPKCFRFSLHNLDSIFYIPQYIEQKEADGIFWVEDEKGDILPWPNKTPCHFCTVDYNKIKKHMKDYNMEDDIFYRDFFFNLLSSRGLTIESQDYLYFKQQEIHKISSQQSLCKLYNLNSFYYLEDFFSGKELIQIRGVGEITLKILLKNGFRIIADLKEREKDLRELLGDKKANSILNNI